MEGLFVFVIKNNVTCRGFDKLSHHLRHLRQGSYLFTLRLLSGIRGLS